MDPEIVEAPEQWMKGQKGGKMLIAPPMEYDALLKTIPMGSLATLSTVREKLALDHGADITCPMTAGIFTRIVAEAAEELLATGEAEDRKSITPWWRLLKADGGLNDKFPGGWKNQAALLKNEGFVMDPGRRKIPRVLDWDKYLAKL